MTKDQLRQIIEDFQKDYQESPKELNKDLAINPPGDETRKPPAAMMPKVKKEPFVQQFTNKNQSVFLRKMKYHQRKNKKLPPIQQHRPSLPGVSSPFSMSPPRTHDASS